MRILIVWAVLAGFIGLGIEGAFYNLCRGVCFANGGMFFAIMNTVRNMRSFEFFKRGSVTMKS